MELCGEILNKLHVLTVLHKVLAMLLGGVNLLISALLR